MKLFWKGNCPFFLDIWLMQLAEWNSDTYRVP